MKRLLITVATALTLSTAAFAGTGQAQDLKELSTKLWKAPKATASLKSQKDELATIYGGEDVSHKLSAETYLG